MYHIQQTNSKLSYLKKNKTKQKTLTCRGSCTLFRFVSRCRSYGFGSSFIVLLVFHSLCVTKVNALFQFIHWSLLTRNWKDEFSLPITVHCFTLSGESSKSHILWLQRLMTCCGKSTSGVKTVLLKERISITRQNTKKKRPISGNKIPQRTNENHNYIPAIPLAQILQLFGWEDSATFPD